MLCKSGRRNDGRCSRTTTTNPATDSASKRKATRNLETRFMFGKSVHDAVKNSGDLLHFRRQFRELLGQDRLHAVRKRFLRVMMHFHEESVCSDGDRSAGEGKHLVAFPGAMAWVHKNRQVTAFFYGWNDGEVQRVAGKVGEGAHAAFAEHNVIVALTQNVFGGHEEFVESCGHSTFEQHRLLCASRPFQQRKILHVARADLYYVGVFFHQIEGFVVDCFGEY